MSDPDSQKAPPQPARTGATPESLEKISSPVPGCLILVTVVIVFALLASLFTYVFYKQSAYFEDDTVTSLEPVEVPQMTPTDAQIAAAKQKLDQLSQAAAENRVDRILFNADDLNALIASQEMLADFRGQTFVKGVSEDGIVAEMTQPIRTGFLRQGVRYLHGDFWAKPERAGKTILFRVVDIQLPEAEVPEGLVASYPAFMKLDPKQEPFDTVLPQIDRIYLEGENIVVETRKKPES